MTQPYAHASDACQKFSKVSDLVYFPHKATIQRTFEK
jgi:hypothetical protein